MSDSNMPVFGRRRAETMDLMTTTPLPVTPVNLGPVSTNPSGSRAAQDRSTAAIVAAAANAAAVNTRADIAELRALCLAKMDATAVASLQPERLLIEVERLISDLATERRVQMNGREQRQLATELVDDMLGLGPLEPLLLDESINDIMVNGPEKCFVERGGKLIQVPVRFRDWQHLTNICQRIAA